MIEIFTKENVPGATAQRSTENSVMLQKPADISFGKATPGIAYYEKSGADLSVVLLDQSVVLIRNFFAIGPEGQASRLLKDDGSVEITGLVAPEPFVIRDATPQVEQVEKADEAIDLNPEINTAQAAVAPAPIIAEPIGDDSQAAAMGGAQTAAVETDGGGVLGFGENVEFMGFLGVNGLLFWAATSGGSDDAPVAEPATAPAAAVAMDADLAQALMAEPETSFDAALAYIGVQSDDGRTELGADATAIDSYSPVSDALFAALTDVSGYEI